MLKDVLRSLQRHHDGALFPLVLLDDLVELKILVPILSHMLHDLPVMKYTEPRKGQKF